MWDINIQTEKIIKAGTLDLVEDEEDRTCQIIYFKVPNDRKNHHVKYRKNNKLPVPSY